MEWFSGMSFGDKFVIILLAIFLIASWRMGRSKGSKKTPKNNNGSDTNIT